LWVAPQLPGRRNARGRHPARAALARREPRAHHLPDPLFLLSLRQTDSRTNVLANPRIRVKNKEKARIHIGDRVPVITTTSAVSGGFVSNSVSYLDVGLQLEVEPLIYLEDDVGIKVGLEVSSITNTIPQAGGGLVYQIGTRKTNTVLRLRDGETQILAGLITDQDQRNATRVPGIGDLPVLGRLFSSTNDTTTKTEIVLLITPRLMRTIARPMRARWSSPRGPKLHRAAARSGRPPRPRSPRSNRSQRCRPLAGGGSRCPTAGRYARAFRRRATAIARRRAQALWPAVALRESPREASP